MKKYYLSFICSLLLASSAHATIHCSKPKLSEPVPNDSIFHFKAVVNCELLNETINLQGLKDAYLDDIVKKGSQFKVKKQQNYSKKGMTGYQLDATQSYDTPHGAMRVRADIIIADNQTNKFFFELRSKSISAEGDAQLDKSILNTTTLDLQPNKGELKVVKEINVEEPWYAPEGTFFDTVQSELSESISKSARANAEKICGKKVDALRK